MHLDNFSPLADKLSHIRQETSHFLPIGNSFIPYDILLAVIRGSSTGIDLTVKTLFASLPYSPMGIRKHFNKLVEDNWIELHNGDADSRVKRVKPSEKLKSNFKKLNDALDLNKS